MQKQILFLVIIASTLLYHCKRDTNTNQIQIDSAKLKLEQKFEQAKEILYSLPSPNEVTQVLLQVDNTKFYADLLNNTNNYTKYNSEVSMALNLGIYSADLSYASLFEQNQIAVNYMATCKKLADNLRILDAFNQETIERMEKNITNRDSIMRIISETFMNSDAYLQESNRQDIGALILIGGWIEGLYLATQLTHGKVDYNPHLVSSILDQQLSLELIIKFLKDFNSQKIQSVFKHIDDLYEVYSSLRITSNENLSLMTCPQSDFEKLYKKVSLIRTEIVNMN